MPVISLTSVPPRFAHVQGTLRSLLDQTAHVDEVRLYIPKTYRRYPEWDGALPEVPKGVRIVRVDEDFGPATKVLPAVRDLKGCDTPILFCDDDRIYHRDWAKTLLRWSRARPTQCIAGFGEMLDMPASAAREGRFQPRHKAWDMTYRAHRAGQKLVSATLHPKTRKPFRKPTKTSGHADILLGYAGACVRPGFFDASVAAIPDALWMVDDFWLSGHLARRNIGIWVPNDIYLSVETGADKIDPLQTAQFGGVGRRASNAAAIAYFRQNFRVWL